MSITPITRLPISVTENDLYLNIYWEPRGYPLSYYEMLSEKRLFMSIAIKTGYHENRKTPKRGVKDPQLHTITSSSQRSRY